MKEKLKQLQEIKKLLKSFWEMVSEKTPNMPEDIRARYNFESLPRDLNTRLQFINHIISVDFYNKYEEIFNYYKYISKNKKLSEEEINFFLDLINSDDILILSNSVIVLDSQDSSLATNTDYQKELTSSKETKEQIPAPEKREILPRTVSIISLKAIAYIEQRKIEIEQQKKKYPQFYESSSNAKSNPSSDRKQGLGTMSKATGLNQQLEEKKKLFLDGLAGVENILKVNAAIEPSEFIEACQKKDGGGKSFFESMFGSLAINKEKSDQLLVLLRRKKDNSMYNFDPIRSVISKITDEANFNQVIKVFFDALSNVDNIGLSPKEDSEFFINSIKSALPEPKTSEYHPISNPNELKIVNNQFRKVAIRFKDNSDSGDYKTSEYHLVKTNNKFFILTQGMEALEIAAADFSDPKKLLQILQKSNVRLKDGSQNFLEPITFVEYPENFPQREVKQASFLEESFKSKQSTRSVDLKLLELLYSLESGNDLTEPSQKALYLMVSEILVAPGGILGDVDGSPLTKDKVTDFLRFFCYGIDEVRDERFKALLVCANFAGKNNIVSGYGLDNSFAARFFQDSQYAGFVDNVVTATADTKLTEEEVKQILSGQKHLQYNNGAHHFGLVFSQERTVTKVYVQDSTTSSVGGKSGSYLAAIKKVLDDRTDIEIVETIKRSNVADTIFKREGDKNNGINNECRYAAIIFSQRVLNDLKDPNKPKPTQYSIQYTQQDFEEQFAAWYDGKAAVVKIGGETQTPASTSTTFPNKSDKVSELEQQLRSMHERYNELQISTNLHPHNINSEIAKQKYALEILTKYKSILDDKSLTKEVLDGLVCHDILLKRGNPNSYAFDIFKDFFEEKSYERLDQVDDFDIAECAQIAVKERISRIEQQLQQQMEALEGISGVNTEYTAIGINKLLGACTKDTNAHLVEFIGIGNEYTKLLEQGLENLLNGSGKDSLLIPLLPNIAGSTATRNHFTALYVRNNNGTFEAFYIDPVGRDEVTNIPPQIIRNLYSLGIGINDIRPTTNRIQYSKENTGRKTDVFSYEITNNHCGPFVVYILKGLADGSIVLEDAGNEKAKLLERKNGISFYQMTDLSETESDEFGKNLRKLHYSTLTSNLPPVTSIISQTSTAATKASEEDPYNPLPKPPAVSKTKEVDLDKIKQDIAKLEDLNKYSYIEDFKKRFELENADPVNLAAIEKINQRIADKSTELRNIYLSLLGFDSNQDLSEIRVREIQRIFNKKSLIIHPDKVAETASEEEKKLMEKAFDCLSKAKDGIIREISARDEVKEFKQKIYDKFTSELSESEKSSLTLENFLEKDRDESGFVKFKIGLVEYSYNPERGVIARGKTIVTDRYNYFIKSLDAKESLIRSICNKTSIGDGDIIGSKTIINFTEEIVNDLELDLRDGKLFQMIKPASKNPPMPGNSAAANEPNSPFDFHSPQTDQASVGSDSKDATSIKRLTIKKYEDLPKLPAQKAEKSKEFEAEKSEFIQNFLRKYLKGEASYYEIIGFEADTIVDQEVTGRTDPLGSLFLDLKKLFEGNKEALKALEYIETILIDKKLKSIYDNGFERKSISKKSLGLKAEAVKSKREDLAKKNPLSSFLGSKIGGLFNPELRAIRKEKDEVRQKVKENEQKIKEEEGIVKKKLEEERKKISDQAAEDKRKEEEKAAKKNKLKQEIENLVDDNLISEIVEHDDSKKGYHATIHSDKKKERLKNIENIILGESLSPNTSAGKIHNAIRQGISNFINKKNNSSGRLDQSKFQLFLDTNNLSLDEFADYFFEELYKKTSEKILELKNEKVTPEVLINLEDKLLEFYNKKAGRKLDKTELFEKFADAQGNIKFNYFSAKQKKLIELTYNGKEIIWEGSPNQTERIFKYQSIQNCLEYIQKGIEDKRGSYADILIDPRTKFAATDTRKAILSTAINRFKDKAFEIWKKQYVDGNGTREEFNKACDDNISGIVLTHKTNDDDTITYTFKSDSIVIDKEGYVTNRISIFTVDDDPLSIVDNIPFDNITINIKGGAAKAATSAKKEVEKPRFIYPGNIEVDFERNSNKDKAISLQTNNSTKARKFFDKIYEKMVPKVESEWSNFSIYKDPNPVKALSAFLILNSGNFNDINDVIFVKNEDEIGVSFCQNEVKQKQNDHDVKFVIRIHEESKFSIFYKKENGQFVSLEDQETEEQQEFVGKIISSLKDRKKQTLLGSTTPFKESAEAFLSARFGLSSSKLEKAPEEKMPEASTTSVDTTQKLNEGFQNLSKASALGLTKGPNSATGANDFVQKLKQKLEITDNTFVASTNLHKSLVTSLLLYATDFPNRCEMTETGKFLKIKGADDQYFVQLQVEVDGSIGIYNSTDKKITPEIGTNGSVLDQLNKGKEVDKLILEAAAKIIQPILRGVTVRLKLAREAKEKAKKATDQGNPTSQNTPIPENSAEKIIFSRDHLIKDLDLEKYYFLSAKLKSESNSVAIVFFQRPGGEICFFNKLEPGSRRISIIRNDFESFANEYEEITLQSEGYYQEKISPVLKEESDKEKIKNISRKLSNNEALSSEEKTILLAIKHAFSHHEGLVQNYYKYPIKLEKKDLIDLLKFLVDGNKALITNDRLRLCLYTSKTEDFDKVKTIFGSANSFIHEFFQGSDFNEYVKDAAVKFSHTDLNTKNLASDDLAKIKSGEKYLLCDVGTGSHYCGLVFDKINQDGNLTVYVQDSTAGDKVDKAAQSELEETYLNLIKKVYPDLVQQKIKIVKTTKRQESSGLRAEIFPESNGRGVESEFRYTAIIFSQKVLNDLKDPSKPKPTEYSIKYTQQDFEEQFAAWYDDKVKIVAKPKTPVFDSTSKDQILKDQAATSKNTAAIPEADNTTISSSPQTDQAIASEALKEVANPEIPALSKTKDITRIESKRDAQGVYVAFPSLSKADFKTVGGGVITATNTAKYKEEPKPSVKDIYDADQLSNASTEEFNPLTKISIVEEEKTDSLPQATINKVKEWQQKLAELKEKLDLDLARSENELRQKSAQLEEERKRFNKLLAISLISYANSFSDRVIESEDKKFMIIKGADDQYFVQLQVEGDRSIGIYDSNNNPITPPDTETIQSVLDRLNKEKEAHVPTEDNFSDSETSVDEDDLLAELSSIIDNKEITSPLSNDESKLLSEIMREIDSTTDVINLKYPIKEGIDEEILDKEILLKEDGTEYSAVKAAKEKMPNILRGVGEAEKVIDIEDVEDKKGKRIGKSILEYAARGVLNKAAEAKLKEEKSREEINQKSWEGKSAGQKAWYKRFAKSDFTGVDFSNTLFMTRFVNCSFSEGCKFDDLENIKPEYFSDCWFHESIFNSEESLKKKLGIAEGARPNRHGFYEIAKAERKAYVSKKSPPAPGTIINPIASFKLGDNVTVNQR